MSIKRWNSSQIASYAEAHQYMRVYAGVQAARILKHLDRKNQLAIGRKTSWIHQTQVEYYKSIYKSYCYFHNNNKKK